MMASSDPAKRKLLRPPMRIECAREDDDGTHFLGYGSNLSETGIFVQSMAPRPTGTKLRLVLYLGGPTGTRICSEAEVRWTRGYGGKKAPSAGMGLRFTNLRPADRNLLQTTCSVPAVVESAIITVQARVERRNEG
jgi:uncharacterized protein (TIGR02266 family)